ncbi:response regulator [Pullulanibacillus sp. KACC 23026]|uniref:response regulator n=1 Tax=Pullulanibacillus sp. KACC 23026 TaxID=3028315 RepID=UPI0023AF74F4|nr:response regulator [Pullulanibacillus sp. KACC 23026]WEG10967.1 response regulator [Pullulanibacillus sp. KACC 23026]
MTIKTRFLLVLSMLPVLILLLLGIGWLQSANLNKISDMIQNKYQTSLLAEKTYIEVKNEAVSLRNLVILTNADARNKELLNIKKEADLINKNIALLDSNVQSTKQKKMVKSLKETNVKYNAYKAQVLSLISKGKKAEAIQLINNKSSSIQNSYFQIISNLTSYLDNETATSLDRLSHDFEMQIAIGSVISFAAILFVIIFIFKSLWSILTRINKVSTTMSGVANGSTGLNTRVAVTSNDEIDQVAISFNKMVQSLEEQMEKEQNLIWSKSNIAEITTELNGKHDLGSLSKTVLSKIAPLVESSHAVLYVKEMDDRDTKPVFRLSASYALKDRQLQTNVFQIGEGLIGQAALEKKPIVLTNVPSDYIQVRSGLGEASPHTIYVFPICFEEDVKAVLEIATFKPFNFTQQSFLEELINGLGIIFESTMGRIRLARLLEESQTLMEEVQAQSEELQTQQEELRATNEELEEQTQALRQSEEKLQVQQEELEQINAELKEKAVGLEEQNRKFELTNREVEKARAELEEKAKQLMLSSKYKSEFLANMSHELRTPLNSLLILSKLLSENQEGNLSDRQIEFTKTIYSSGIDLLTLINDILDLAKIESGKMDVNPSKVFIKDLVDFVESTFRPVANEKRLTLNIVLADNLPKYIISDFQRLQQVLRNLLSNAFKFTHAGDVTLKIEFNDRYQFSVIDTGIGIAKDKQDLIFQAFQQADGTMSRRYGGTGLGLSICREIATLLDGNVRVESEEGRGSTFTFEVGNHNYEERDLSQIKKAVTKDTSSDVQEFKGHPVIQSAPSNLPEYPIDHPNSYIKRLIIVDDDIKQRNSLMELIGEKNVIIKAVSSGTEAIEEIKVNPYDCMVLDLGLMDMTGFELLEKIKLQRDFENLKVFIYTGRSLTTKEEIILNRYAHTIIIKDAQSPERLKDELDMYLKLSNEEIEKYGQIEEQVKKASGLEGKRILLVDDDVRNVYALSSILEIQGIDITFAENGREGLEVLEKDDGFDLVLMDIMMPEMDGYEAIRRIREQPQLNHLPIIALTAKAMKEDREKCMEVGASDYIVKPIDPDQLISLIKVWVYQ